MEQEDEKFGSEIHKMVSSEEQAEEAQMQTDEEQLDHVSTAHIRLQKPILVFEVFFPIFQITIECQLC